MKPKCCLCGRPAFILRDCYDSYPPLTPQLSFECSLENTPLCEECTLSAAMQGVLDWMSDTVRVSDFTVEELLRS